MNELIPRGVDNFLKRLRPRLRELEAGGYKDDLGDDFPCRFGGRGTKPPGMELPNPPPDDNDDYNGPLGIPYWADQVWRRWLLWVHANVECDNILLDEKGRRVAPPRPGQQASSPPGHKDLPTSEYQGACPLVLDGENENDFIQAAQVLLTGCILDVLPAYRFTYGKNLKMYPEQPGPGIGRPCFPESIWYVVEKRLIGKDAISFACKYKSKEDQAPGHSYPDVAMQRTYKTRLDDLFCQMSQEAKKARADFLRGDANPTRSINFTAESSDGESWPLDKEDDYDPFEDLVSADQWTAAQESVRHRACEPGCWLTPENASLVFCLTIADSGAFLRRPCTDRQLAKKLREQSGDKTWDRDRAAEARELVAAWTQAFLIERCGYDTPDEDEELGDNRP